VTRFTFPLLVLLLTGCCSHEPLAAETLQSFRLYESMVIPSSEISADAQRELGGLGDDIDEALRVLAGEEVAE